MSKQGRVLVAMSGGIDSTMAAVMLHQQGYEVIGMTMKTWDYASSGGSKKETGCCSLDSINDAREVAVDLGFPHYVLDIRKEFGNFIIDNFVDEYLAGRTPNPCVLCNTHIKWEALLKRADQLNCDYIATGHYAKVRKVEGRYAVSKAKDLHKDQSYVLWGVSQKNLSRTIFPLGNYLKSEVRKLAMELGYKELANKSESYEICFVPDNDYRGFLKRNVNGLEEKVADGDFVLSDGEVVGKHKGYPFYTIGQRKGLEMAFGKPMFVTNIHTEKNTVEVGPIEELERQQMMVSQLNFIKYGEIQGEMEVSTKIRYKDPGTLSIISQKNDTVTVEFKAPVNAIAPGQSAVFYEGDDVIGGGIIQSAQ